MTAFAKPMSVSLPGFPAVLPERALLPVVVGGRELLALTFDQELVLVVLVADLGARFLELVGLADVELLRRVGRGRPLVRVEGVDACLDALLLGQPGQLVVVDTVRAAAVLTAIAV